MIMTAEQPITLDQTGKETGLPQSRTAAGADMLEFLSGIIHELYGGQAV